MDRHVVALGLLLMSYFFIAPARAACTYSVATGGGGTASCDTQAEASQADLHFTFNSSYYDGFIPSNRRPTHAGPAVLDAASKRYTWTVNDVNSVPVVGIWVSASYITPCPTGMVPIDGTCTDPDARCLALNEGIALQGDVPRTWTSYCAASGCQLEMQPGYTTTTTNGLTIYRGQILYSGACPGTLPPTDPNIADGSTDDSKPRQECVSAGAGQTMCIKPNGEHCYSVKVSGRYICWGAGETGEKSDGPSLQVRGPGTTSPDAPTPPPGETFDPPSDPVTETTTGPSNISITTTVTYNTTNGTDAGPNNQGESNDGNSGTDGGQPGGEGTASGGADCSAPPQCANDAVGCAILAQSWHNRCAVEGDGKGAAQGALDGADDGLPDGDTSDTEVSTETVDSDFLGQGSGWAGRGSCPINISFDIALGSYTLPNEQLCSLLDAIAALVSLAGYVAAGIIVSGGFKTV